VAFFLFGEIVVVVLLVRAGITLIMVTTASEMIRLLLSSVGTDDGRKGRVAAVAVGVTAGFLVNRCNLASSCNIFDSRDLFDLRLGWGWGGGFRLGSQGERGVDAGIVGAPLLLVVVAAVTRSIGRMVRFLGGSLKGVIAR